MDIEDRISAAFGPYSYGSCERAFLVAASSVLSVLRFLPAAIILRPGAFVRGAAVLRLHFSPKVASFVLSGLSLLGAGEWPVG